MSKKEPRPTYHYSINGSDEEGWTGMRYKYVYRKMGTDEDSFRLTTDLPEVVEGKTVEEVLIIIKEIE